MRDETERNRIKNSTGWRLLNSYGPIRDRFVLPFYRRVCRVLDMQSPPADNYERVISFLRSHGGEGIAHINGTVLPHLEGTFDLLQKWGNPAPLCFAGLCHAVYGTVNFKTSLVDVSSRAELRAFIGPEAEAMVYLFASCDRGYLYPQIGQSSPVQFRDRFSGEVFVPDNSLLRSFLELTFANELQIVSSNAALVEATRPIFGSLFKRCRGLVSEAAYAYFVDVYGVHDAQHVEQVQNPRHDIV